MGADFTVGQSALVVIAIAVSLQTLLLIAGAWIAIRMWKDVSVKVERRVNALQGRIEALTDAAEQTAETHERCVRTTSTVFRRGEQLASLLATTGVAPRAMLAAGAASKLILSWRRRHRSDGDSPPARVAGLSKHKMLSGKPVQNIDSAIARPGDS